MVNSMSRHIGAIRWVGPALAFLLLVGTAVIDFATAATLLAGILLALLATAAVRKSGVVRLLKLAGLSALAGLIVGALALAFFSFGFHFTGRFPGYVPPEHQYPLDAYAVRISPEFADRDQFVITETVWVSDTRLAVATTHPATRRDGLGVRRLSFQPLQHRFYDAQLVEYPADSFVVPARTPESGWTVTLERVERGAFFEATIDKSGEARAFAGTETIRYRADTLTQPIEFRYMVPWALALRPFLGPFFGVTSLGKVALVCLGLVLCTVWGILQRFLLSRVEKWLSKKFGGKQDAAGSEAAS